MSFFVIKQTIQTRALCEGDKNPMVGDEKKKKIKTKLVRNRREGTNKTKPTKKEKERNKKNQKNQKKVTSCLLKKRG